MVISMNNGQKENSVMSSDQESYIMLPNGTLLPITESQQKPATSYKSDQYQQSNIVMYNPQQTLLQPVMQQQIIQAMAVEPNSNLVTFSFQQQPNYILQPAQIISQPSQAVLLPQASVIQNQPVIMNNQPSITTQAPRLQSNDLLSQSIQNIFNYAPHDSYTSQSQGGYSNNTNTSQDNSGNLLSQAWSLSCVDEQQTQAHMRAPIQHTLQKADNMYQQQNIAFPSQAPSDPTPIQEKVHPMCTENNTVTIKEHPLDAAFASPKKVAPVRLPVEPLQVAPVVQEADTPKSNVPLRPVADVSESEKALASKSAAIVNNLKPIVPPEVEEQSLAEEPVAKITEEIQTPVEVDENSMELPELYTEIETKRTEESQEEEVPSPPLIPEKSSEIVMIESVASAIASAPIAVPSIALLTDEKYFHKIGEEEAAKSSPPAKVLTPIKEPSTEPEKRRFSRMTSSDIADLCSIVETKIKPKTVKRPSIFEEMSARMAKVLNCEVKDISVDRDKVEKYKSTKGKAGSRAPPTLKDLSMLPANKNSGVKQGEKSKESYMPPKLIKPMPPKLTKHPLSLYKTISDTKKKIEKTGALNNSEILSKLNKSLETAKVQKVIEIPKPKEIQKPVVSNESSMELPELYTEVESKKTEVEVEETPEKEETIPESPETGRPSRKRKLPKKLTDVDVTIDTKGLQTPPTDTSSPTKLCLRDAKKPKLDKLKDDKLIDKTRSPAPSPNSKRVSLRLKQHSENSPKKVDPKQKKLPAKPASSGTYTVDLCDLMVSLNARGEVVLKMPESMRGSGKVNINFDIDNLDEDDCLRFKVENEEVVDKVFNDAEDEEKEAKLEAAVKAQGESNARPASKRPRTSTKSSETTSSSSDSSKPMKKTGIMNILSNNPKTPEKLPPRPATVVDIQPQLDGARVIERETQREVRDCSTQVCLTKPLDFSKDVGDSKEVVKSCLSDARGFTSYQRFSSITATSTAHIHRVLKHVKKGLSLDPTDKALTWFCGLCQQPGDFGDLGPLFGPYDLMVPPQEKSGKTGQPNTAGLSEGVKNLFEKLHSALSTLRHTNEITDSLDKDGEKQTLVREIMWLHEDCVCWSPGVYMLGFDMFGLEEVFRVARVTECSHCSKLGASLGCFSEGCTLRYHYLCALHADCTLITDTFTVLCTTHARVRVDSSKAVQAKPLVKVRKHLLKEHLQNDLEYLEKSDLKRKKRKNPDRPVVSLKLSKSKSSKEKRYTKQCDICRKSFPKSMMDKHMLKHKENGDQKGAEHVPKCDKCNTKFNTHSVFMAHMSVAHNDQAPYKCVECQKGYSHSSAVRKHRKYSCPYRQRT